MVICLQKPEILSLRANEILTAVIHGARKEEPSADVQLAAIHALYNSLEFVRENFDRDVRFFAYRASWGGFFFRVLIVSDLGRTELHHAGRMRSYTEFICGRPSWSL